jgi:trans-aconitate 2-methyltransferase
MNKKDWNPDLYLKFNRERIQPSIDLVSRIDHDNPLTIADIGCGPGNSTQVLLQRWADADITGFDNSEAMIEKARGDFPRQNWVLRDAGRDPINETFDILFSNATIQWIPDHEKLLKKFHGLLNAKGVIAVQVPLFWEMPLGKSIMETAEAERWKSATKDATEQFTIHTPSWYYDTLSRIFSSINMWQTDYIHIMESHTSILEMIRSTGLKPYMEKLESEEEKSEFENLVFKKIQEDYPLQKNGKALFPFKRLFFTAGK